MSQTNEIERSVPDVAPAWSELYERSPHTADAYDDPTGGVVVHRCHPSGEATDYFAFAFRHETMKGFVDKKTYLYDGKNELGEGPDIDVGVSRWNSAVNSFHFREGSHEDCAVCQGEAVPADILNEVIETATDQVGGEDNVARTSISTGHDRSPRNKAFVYLDSHGSYASGGTYDVDNSTRHWEECVRAHPYVEMIGAEEVGEGGNWASPNNTLKITLATWYPNTTSGVVV